MAVIQSIHRSTTARPQAVSIVLALFLYSCNAPEYNVNRDGESPVPAGTAWSAAGNRGTQGGEGLSGQSWAANAVGPTAVGGASAQSSNVPNPASISEPSALLVESTLGGLDGGGRSNRGGGNGSISPSGGRAPAYDSAAGGSATLSSVASLGGNANANSVVSLGGTSTLSSGGSLGADSRPSLGGAMASTAMVNSGGVAVTSAALGLGGDGSPAVMQGGSAAGTNLSPSSGGTLSSTAASSVGGATSNGQALSAGGTDGSSAVGTGQYCSSYVDLGSLPNATTCISPVPQMATCYRFKFPNSTALFLGLQMNGCSSSRTASVNGMAICTGDCWKSITISSAADGYWYLSVSAGSDTDCAVSWWRS